MDRSFGVVFLCVVLAGCGEVRDQYAVIARHSYDEQALSAIEIAVIKDGVMTSGTLTLNTSCSNVFGATHPGDWTENSITATSSVSVLAGVACTITMVSYNDGSHIYTATGSPLTINISSSGAVPPASATQYTSGGASPILQWFSASQGASAYAIVINYAADAITNSTVTSTTNLSATTISLSMINIPAPTVLGVTLTISNSAGTYSYTLTATASGATGCKYIDNSNAVYSPTSWTSVNTAYGAVGATSCPTLTPGSATVGNWNSLWHAGKTTLVMWANALGGVNAYTTANFGP